MLDEAARRGFVRDVAAEMRALGIGANRARREAALRWERLQARLEWLRERFDRLRELDDALSEYWGAYFDAHPEIDPEDPDCPPPPDPPEWAERQAIEEEIEAVRERDEWPRHLHFRDV